MPAEGKTLAERDTQAQLDAIAADAGRAAAKRALETADLKVDAATLEAKGDMIANRAANIILKGGSSFLPTSIKEATDMAKVWNAIAASQTARRKGLIDDAKVEDVDAAAEVAQLAAGNLDLLKRKMKVVA